VTRARTRTTRQRHPKTADARWPVIVDHTRTPDCGEEAVGTFIYSRSGRWIFDPGNVPHHIQAYEELFPQSGPRTIDRLFDAWVARTQAALGRVTWSGEVRIWTLPVLEEDMDAIAARLAEHGIHVRRWVATTGTIREEVPA
jgi:hypothetical protein